jgi:translation initiation factor IF-3
MDLDAAIERAKDVGLDLIEVSPNAKPPVAKILNYGKLKYEEKKKQQASKKKQHVVKVKEIRVRPRIDTHDLETKVNLGRKFISDGCKLKVKEHGEKRDKKRPKRKGEKKDRDVKVEKRISNR